MNGAEIVNEIHRLNEEARQKAVEDFIAGKGLNNYPLHSKQRAAYNMEMVRLRGMALIRVQQI